jgi:hypothetical protein
MIRDVDEREVLALANAVVNTPAHMKICVRIVQKLGLNDGPRIIELRRQLAYAYAQGWIRGRNAAREGRSAVPDAPSEAPES